MQDKIAITFIEEEYKATTAPLVEIAEYHGINYNTLKSYAKRHNWQKNEQDGMILERLFYPEKCSSIPYRVAVFGFLVSIYNINQIAAYRFAYGSKPTTARVNSYRMLKREDTQFIIRYSKVLFDATSNYYEFLELLKPIYKNAFLDAEIIAERIMEHFSSVIGDDEAFNTPFGLKRFKAVELEPEPLQFQVKQVPKL